MIAFVTIVALMISGSYAVIDDLRPVPVCKLMADGTKIRDVKYCETYYVCVGGVATQYTCSEGTVFNKDEQRCTSVYPPQSIVHGKTHPICTADWFAMYVADPYSCDVYYYCNGVIYDGKYKCPPGTVFNQELQTCKPGDVSECYKGTSNRDTICNIVSNASNVEFEDAICGVVPNNKPFGVASTCNSWALCHEGIYSTKACSHTDPRMMFNTNNGECDYYASCTQTSA